MKSLSREALYAFLSWLIPFFASICLFPLKRSRVSLFETLMSITLVGTTVLLGCLYLRPRPSKLPALRIGLTWMLANWALDVLVFSHAPMHMTLSHYLSEIAGAYLIIPIITTGLAFASPIIPQQTPAPFRGTGASPVLPKRF